MKSIRKFSAGAYLTCVTIIAAAAGLITYGLNIAGTGYFKGRSVHNLVLYVALAMLLWMAAIVLGQLPLQGKSRKAAGVTAGLMQIGAPALVAAGMMGMVSSRVEGLGYIFFSNPDVLKEVQTPGNLSSAYMAIACIIVLAAAMLLGMISAFFRTERQS